MEVRKSMVTYTRKRWLVTSANASECYNRKASNTFLIEKWIAEWSPHISLQVLATGLLRSENEWSAELFSWPLIAPRDSFHLPAWKSDFKLTDFYMCLSFDLKSRTLRGKFAHFDFPFNFTLMTELIQTFWGIVIFSFFLFFFKTSFWLGMPCKHIFSLVQCGLRELWYYLLWRSRCCSSLCLCFDSDNSSAYMGSRQWQGDHQNKESLQLHS